MKRLFETLLSLLWLRAGPQDLPASWSLVAAVMLASLGLDIAILSGLEGPVPAGSMLLTQTLFQAGAIGLMLAVRKRLPRLPQTLLALYGTSMILSVPLLVLLPAAAGETGEANPLVQMGTLLLLLWSFVISIHILRQALELPSWLVVLLTFGLWLLTAQLATPVA